jgi:hypothetical protein
LLSCFPAGKLYETFDARLIPYAKIDNKVVLYKTNLFISNAIVIGYHIA